MTKVKYYLLKDLLENTKNYKLTTITEKALAVLEQQLRKVVEEQKILQQHCKN